MASDSPSTITTSAIVSGLRIASRLINACLMHVSELSGMKRKKQKDRAFLDDLGRFRLWAHGFDALPTESDDIPEDALYQAQIPEQDGGPGSVNIQFDEVLECSEYLKEPTITLLTGFASCLLLAKLSNSKPLEFRSPPIYSKLTVRQLVMTQLAPWYRRHSTMPSSYIQPWETTAAMRGVTKAGSPRSGKFMILWRPYSD